MSKHCWALTYLVTISHAQVLLVRSSGCDDYDFLVYSGHTDAFDYPISREALSVASEWGRRLDQVPENSTARSLKEHLRADIEEVAGRARASRKLSTAISNCVTAYTTDTYNSW